MTEYPPDAAAVLTTIARDAITHRVHLRPPTSAPAVPDEAWLREPGAAFVTLRADGRLRGCIGSLEAHRPLGDDVAANAVNAATRDVRFVEVEPEELDGIEIEVSVLSAATPLTFTSQADALAQLRPGIDGVILEHDGRRATFLPQVWETVPEPEEFIAALLLKAGLPRDLWDERLRLWRYEVTAFEET